MTNLVLFVGAEQPLWEEFRAFSAGTESVWAAEFAHTGAEASARMETSSFAAVVSDVQLLDTKGLALLDEAMVRQPKAFRLVLSDMADTQSTVACVGRTHHHLVKPCDVSMLLSALGQANALEVWLPSDRVQELIGRMRWVPSPPDLYFKVAAEMQSANASVETVGQLIAQDPAITAKILQLANSAVFGLRLQVLEPIEAVAYLGLETTKALVLLAHTFASFEKEKQDGFSVESLWHHSVLAGRFARRIAQAENSGPERAEQAAAGGLLHDLGILLLAANMPQQLAHLRTVAREESILLWQAELKTLGATHADLGACLLGIWNLPKPIIEAVALHHNPLQLPARGFGPLTAVHVANVFAHQAAPDPAASITTEVDPDYLLALGIDHRLEEWRSQCLEPEPSAA